MKTMTILQRTGISILFISMLSFSQLRSSEIKIIDENMQSWKAITAYGNGEQDILVNKETKKITLTKVGVTKSVFPTGATNVGPCTEGYIQLSNSQSSVVKLPTIQGGVTKLELNIITTTAATRTVDVKISETGAVTTLSELNRIGNTYPVMIGTTGNTTILIENVTGGVIYITDIKVYQNQGETEISNDATLSSLSYAIDSQSFSIPDFTSSKTIYNIELPAGTTNFPVVSAIKNQKDAVVSINQITEYPGSAIVNVKASDNISTKEYKINFMVSSNPVSIAKLPLNASATNTENPLQEFIGFSAQNLGSPMSDGGVKFEGSKALTEQKPMLILAFDSQADELSFEMKGNNAGSPSGFEGIDFIVEESENGTAYTSLADLSSTLTTSKQIFKGYTLKPESRYIRWTYQNTIKGNLSLNNIVITKAAADRKSVV